VSGCVVGSNAHTIDVKREEFGTELYNMASRNVASRLNSPGPFQRYKPFSKV
jgi:hypothetical protein